MHYSTVSIPEYPDTHVIMALWTGLSNDYLNGLLNDMKSPHNDWDICLVNTLHLVSCEQLHSSIYRSIRNYKSGIMKANSLDAEIIFNLSPANKIMDAFKRFGVDPNCPNLLTIRVIMTEKLTKELYQNAFQDIQTKLNLRSELNVVLDDSTLFKLMDLPKIRKIFKLNDAVLDDSLPNLQADLTRLLINAALLRGY